MRWNFIRLLNLHKWTEIMEITGWVIQLCWASTSSWNDLNVYMEVDAFFLHLTPCSKNCISPNHEKPQTFKELLQSNILTTSGFPTSRFQHQCFTTASPKIAQFFSKWHTKEKYLVLLSCRSQCNHVNDLKRRKNRWHSLSPMSKYHNDLLVTQGQEAKPYVTVGSVTIFCPQTHAKSHTNTWCNGDVSIPIAAESLLYLCWPANQWNKGAMSDVTGRGWKSFLLHKLLIQ